jgi:hypothetical protein
MYRSCIFCSAPLGSNESIERFPVGRSLAFDAARGRLWAVCPKCARWNLAPIEERWEAIEDAERLFRDTRMRAQSENIGLAKMRDGTRLVRVGDALAGELAVWRYGETLARRRRRMLIRSAPASVAGAGVLAAGITAGIMIGTGAILAWSVGTSLVDLAGDELRWRKVILHVRGEDGSIIRVRRRQLAHARLATEGEGMELHLPPLPADGRAPDVGTRPLVLRGPEARMALGRAMVDVNGSGASRREIDQALTDIQRAGSPEDLLVSAGRQRLLLSGYETPAPTLLQRWKARCFGPETPDTSAVRGAWGRVVGLDDGPSVNPVAMEMALHEETERRALQGELAMLEAMWRDAEEIASIADRLPELAAPEPPRLSAES